MSLALGMPVGRMLAEMPSSELTEYMAFETVDGPLGDRRADIRAGIVAAAVVNHSMSPPKRPARPVDYMPFDEANAKAREPIKLDDPVQHGRFIATTLFAGMQVRDSRKH